MDSSMYIILAKKYWSIVGGCSAWNCGCFNMEIPLAERNCMLTTCETMALMVANVGVQRVGDRNESVCFSSVPLPCAQPRLTVFQ